jgi:hypothetical protein
MASDEKKDTSLPKRLSDRIRDAAAEWLEALEGLLAPAPQLVPIPVRRPQRPRQYR